MKEFLSGDTLYAKLMMLLPHEEKAFIVVEGEDDQLLLQSHVSDDAAVLIPGEGGKRGVLQAAQQAWSHGWETVRFIVDRDFDDCRSAAGDALPANTIVSRGHDLVMDVVREAQWLLRRFVLTRSRGKLEYRGERIEARSVVEHALLLAYGASLVRLALRGLPGGPSSRDFPFDKIRPEAFWRPATSDLVHALSGRGASDAYREEVLRRVSEDRISAESVNIDLVGDHDLFRALATVMRKCGVSSVSPRDIESSFFAGIDCISIQRSTPVYEVSTWGESIGIRIMSCPYCQRT